MNILYLSHLSGHYSSGPTYSVPQQIKAQSEIDNVFWFNAVKHNVKNWNEYEFYHDLQELGRESIEVLPAPFNHPDLIIVELFYNMIKSPFIRELLRLNLPYIIIPRCELTAQAQNKKHFKKAIANILICNKFAAKALAIEYLTEREYIDSGDRWNTRHIIIPNAVEKPIKTKGSFNFDKIKVVFIGRIEPYQKGLDLIIDAITDTKEELRINNCIFSIYGADKENKLVELKKTVSVRQIDDIVTFHDGIFGKEKETVLLENDVFFLTSRFEGHPMALIEALSYGLPCIATTGSNMREEINEYDAGWTSDNTIEGIKSALLAMLKDKNIISIKGKNAIRLAESYYWPEIAAKSHTLYKELTDKSGENK